MTYNAFLVSSSEHFALNMASNNEKARRERLTLSQLASYDDILTDALVDHVCETGSILPRPMQPTFHDRIGKLNASLGLLLDYH